MNQNYFKGSPGCSVGKESACSTGDLGSIPGSGRSPGEGNGNPLQYYIIYSYLNFLFLTITFGLLIKISWDSKQPSS